MSEQHLTASRIVCPFMHRQYEECYSTSLSSQDIEKVTFFCGERYRLCQVYQDKFFSEPVMKTAEFPQKKF